MVRETQEFETIEESEKHRIAVVMIESAFDEPHKMYKLYIKNGDNWFSFRRASYGSGKYFYGLRELQKLAKNYNPGKGFFCTHGIGDPLKEFTKGVYDLEPLPLEPFTSLTRQEGYWAFGGNHRNYSGAFGYKIFDQWLAEMVYNSLSKDGVRAPPNKYHQKLYPVEL